ncbi:acyltransferase family protein [Rarobacter faecitabidus]|uniref:Peptidoglycan/LPS O-acetylase OafA/YrhL n=1 Tax=Rarobacter faecitabidus TaxID=13243 RepID=A0A542ZDV3_RARFA|nr:acyltransferase family protein [Rarobacter faecitabidus]TQL58498.1 peptidoglycan/LPS O-acetylase OafA/YrhL [Rarobacter faecitabidus]
MTIPNQARVRTGAPAPAKARAQAGSAGEPAKSRRHFRADIQALRAIAVLLVVIYHLRPERISGGFIGVDVFFVISGFLITSHLVREAAATGRVRLGAFWAARARRILPASLVTIAVTIGVTAFISPATALEDLRRQALASTFYVQNWVLAGDAVDYSASDNAATAFQHFWSLSVEEQFYVFWPFAVALALLVAVKVAGGRPGPHRSRGDGAFSASAFRMGLMAIFGLIVLASLAYSIWAVRDGRADGYFITTTRIWELGLGGLLAVIGTRGLPRPARYVLAYLGLAAILASAFVLDGDTPFPGLAALPVVLGSAAVIWAGTSKEDESPLARFDPWSFGARLRPAQWVGDRSYSLYLWHFPVIVLWPLIFPGRIGYLDVAAMLVVSLVLAHLSYRFIEQPVRRSAFLTRSTGRSLGFGLTGMVLVAGLAVAYPYIGGRATGDWAELASYAAARSPLGAQAAGDGKVPTFTGHIAAITPSPLVARKDRNIAFSAEDCVAGARGKVTPSCTAGDPDAALTVALVGDSHARMYSTALAQLAERDGFLLTTYLHNSCPFNPIPRDREVRNETVCTAPNSVTMKALLADPPDLVITTWAFNANAHFIEHGATGVPGASGFADYWNQLRDAGSKVLVIADAPEQDQDAVDCVAANYDNPDVCATSRKQALVGLDLLADAAQAAPDATVADFTDAFCTDTICKAVVGNVLVYTDDSHLTDTFAVSLTPRIERAMDSALAS